MMFNIFRSNVLDLPVSISLSYFWCGGFVLGAFCLIQIVSGIFLSLLYCSYEGTAFFCIVEISNSSYFSWLLRYTHIWGVSFIFIFIYYHMGRSLYYASYHKIGVWNTGFLIYLLMMAEAFLGYVLPWHQMSYWAATVITSVVQSVPIFGESLYRYIVGGFGITEVTLTRAFAAHVCLGFFIIGVLVYHVFQLHLGGSNNPLCLSDYYGDSVSFHSYLTFKDVFFFFFIFSFFVYFMLTSPDLFLDCESFIEANAMVTPVSIKPEWYFLSFYAMLRCINTKIGGLFIVLIFLFVLWFPTSNYPVCYTRYRSHIFWWGVSFFFILSFLGGCHPEPPYLGLSRVFTFFLIFSIICFKFPEDVAESIFDWISDYFCKNFFVEYRLLGQRYIYVGGYFKWF